MIIVIGGVKGGSGKTTIATNLAVLRAASGKKILLVDSDEQQSTSTWSSHREALNIPTSWPTVILSGANVHSHLLKMKHDYDDIIIDVGGRNTNTQRSALGVADIFLVPFKPRSLDIWTLGEVRNIISDMRLANPKLKAFAIINQADSKGSENDEAIQILDECEELKCLNFTIGYRKAFGNAASSGIGVIEQKKNVDKKANEEITNLYNFLYTKNTH